MGGAGSTIYGQVRRLVIRYNAENRAQKFLDKGIITAAPRHENKLTKEITLSREALEDIHCKNTQLNEYLKKVYLTSTPKVTETTSKRPKPKKENEVKKTTMFYEPEKAAPGYCTLSNVIQILSPQNDTESWGANEVAFRFNISKNDAVHLLTYYSLFKKENLEFMNEKPEDMEEIQFEVNTPLEKKPLKQITSKSNKQNS